MAVAGLVCGIASLVLSFCGYGAFVGIVCGIAGIILSVMGKKQSPEKKGMCTAGLVLSIIGLVLSVILSIACVLCVAAANEISKEAGYDDLKALSDALNSLN